MYSIIHVCIKKKLYSEIEWAPLAHITLHTDNKQVLTFLHIVPLNDNNTEWFDERYI